MCEIRNQIVQHDLQQQRLNAGKMLLEGRVEVEFIALGT